METETMALKPYPQYKPSGIEWIGEVPEHWKVKRFKYWFDLITTKAEGNGKKIALENIEGKTGRFTETGSQFEGEGVAFKAGDILYGKLRPYLAKVFLADFSGAAVGDFFVFRCKEGVLPEFAARKILDYAFIEITNSSTYGAKMPRVGWEFIANLELAMPPYHEQSQIARFLTHKTRQIDTAITKLRRLIRLLQEERAALINEAVTKGLRGEAAKTLGLDPDPPMKDSGVEWIGEVPGHWRVVRLKYLANSIQTGPFGSQLHATDYVKNGIPVINPANIVNGQIVPDWQCSITEEKSNELNRHRLGEGDIVFGRRGEMGRCALVQKKEEGWICGTGSMLISPNSQRIKPELLVTFLQSKVVKELLSLFSVGTTMANLNATILGELPVTIPPIKEQTMIIAFLLHEDRVCRNNISSIEKEITLLREYRQALISEAVTGKIDVRGYDWDEES